MRLLATVLVASGLAWSLGACAHDNTGPGGAPLYLLRRVGSQPLPAPADPGPQAALYIADSLLIPALKRGSKDPFVVTRITVLQAFSGQRSRTVAQFQATTAEDILTIDSCPIGSFCIASLVYAPSTFKVVGDSLFELVPPTSPDQPRVYGRAPE